MPLEIDLIEQLYAMGEVPLTTVIAMVASPEYAWRVIQSLLIDRTAKLWIRDNAEPRPALPWEVSAVLRDRLHGSAEQTPSDELLVLRSTQRTNDAYHRDFGN